jgi:hypothetical protein
MTFEKFSKEMGIIKKFIDEQNLWQDSLEKLMPDSIFVVSLGNELLDGYIHLIQDSFEKTSKEDWIFYYIYECDMGKHPMSVRINSLSIELDDEQKLYGLMCGNL